MAGELVREPIIILGTGRSGSTLFHDMLAEHPGVSWLSPVLNKWPNKPGRNRRVLALEALPGVRQSLRRRAPPAEVYRYWDQMYPGFSRPFRDLTREDVTPRAKAAFHRGHLAVMHPRRDRLLMKVTGWPRLGFLHEVFPDAKFVHLYRDGRAAAASLLTVDWWKGWQGPYNWDWGPLPPAYAKEWERHDRSFVALAAIQWKLFMDAVEASRAQIPAAQWHEFRYEDFCVDVVGHTRRVTEFAGLPWTPTFEKRVRAFDVAAANDKWRRDLTREQQAAMEDVLAGHLRKYGYV